MEFDFFKRKPKYDVEEDTDIEDDMGGYDLYGDDADADDVQMAPASPSFNANPVSLKIVSPKTYEDARDITEFLMNGNTVLLNMDEVGRDVAMRVIDYLRGAIQVVGGIMTKVGKTTLVVAPKNVDVSSIEAMVGSAE